MTQGRFSTTAAMSASDNCEHRDVKILCCGGLKLGRCGESVEGKGSRPRFTRTTRSMVCITAEVWLDRQSRTCPRLPPPQSQPNANRPRRNSPCRDGRGVSQHPANLPLLFSCHPSSCQRTVVRSEVARKWLARKSSRGPLGFRYNSPHEV